jgi:RimJ/RimL family protein N-acetyltransferase
MVTADGTRVTLRALAASDTAGYFDLFARMSPESRYRRFGTSKPALTRREVAYFTAIDGTDHAAIAAIDQRDGSIVGVARYVRHADRPDAAEVAIEVADALQRVGIGSALARATIERAHANGVSALTARAQWENRPARRLLHRHGFRTRRSCRSELEYELVVTATRPRPVQATAILGVRLALSGRESDVPPSAGEDRQVC